MEEIMDCYKRVLLKMSGEALKGNTEFGIDPLTVKGLAKEIKEVHDLGCEVAIVVGGGNIWRGKTASELGMDRSQADYMGMLATIMNGLAIQDSLEGLGVPTRVMSAIQCDEVCEPYIRRRAIRHLEKKIVTIFVGGTGSPYFSTDTCSGLRAAEINADVIFKATMVDGVYDKDPNKYDDAVRYETLTFSEVLAKQLAVMDMTAASMCRDNKTPVMVFSMKDPDNILRAIKGEAIGTVVSED
jgi:uridylate kinase